MIAKLAAPRKSARSALSAFGLAIPLAFMAQALSSCGDDDGGGTACVPGQQNNCNCSGGLSGLQYCNDEGTAFGACDCGTGGGNGGSANTGGGGGNTSMAGSGGTSTEPPLDLGLIGAPCETTAECSTEADFFCIPSSSNDFGGGGPEGGFCTVACDSTADCTALDGASGCYTPDGATQGFCVALCLPGNGQIKCGNRAQACWANPADPTIGACFPTCRSDEGCGEGRFCDMFGLGLCVDTLPAGGGIGAPCTPETAEADCASDICLTFSDDNDVVVGGFCSAACTYLSLFGCGFGPESTGVRDAACLQEQEAGGGPGDLGFCFELCDTDADCVQADWDCLIFSGQNGPQLQQQLGRQGQCVPQQLVGGGADAGPG